MRRPYNALCDIHKGNLPPIAFQYITTVPCRWIADLYSQATSYPNRYAVGYFTMDAYNPAPPQGVVINPLIYLILDSADYIAFPSGGPLNYRVTFVEEVIYHAEPVYYRVHVEPV